MNIAFVNTLPIWGGCERWVVQVGKGLEKRGHRVFILSLPGSITERNAKEAKLSTFSINITADIAVWKLPRLIRFFKKENIHIAVCVQNRDVKIAALAAKMAKVPVVLARNGLDVIKQRPYHRLAFTNYIDGIMANSKVLKEKYMSYGWFDDDFIEVIYDGLQIHKDVKEIDLRNELGFPKDSKLIVSAGRLVPQKGYDYLIEAAALAKKERKNWRFVVVGEGKQKDFLLAMVDRLDLQAYIKFIGFRKDVLPYMKAGDLFVISSRSEGLSSVLREAMSLGMACVSTAVNGTPELFKDNTAGIMVELHNPEAIFLGIDNVLGNPQLKESLEKNALKRIKEDFLEEVMLDRLEKHFEYRLQQNQASTVE